MIIDSQTLQVIQRNFELEKEIASTDILKALTQAIQYYLDKNFERLVQIMYRLDIDEKNFTDVLTLSEPSLIAENIAKLVLLREQEKHLIRQKYATKT